MRDCECSGSVLHHGTALAWLPVIEKVRFLEAILHQGYAKSKAVLDPELVN